jgi:hypothetical protein
MFDKAEDVPFFVAKTLLFPLCKELPSKSSQKNANIGFFSKLSLL